MAKLSTDAQIKYLVELTNEPINLYSYYLIMHNVLCVNALASGIECIH